MGQFTENKIGPLSIAQTLILLGAIIGIIAVFLNWFSWTIVGYTEAYTGWGFAFGSDFNGISDFQKYCPLIAWIMAIIILIVTALPLAKIDVLDSKKSGIIVIVCAILMIIFSIVWSMWTIKSGFVSSKMMDHASFGMWLMIIGGVIGLIGGALPLVDKN